MPTDRRVEFTIGFKDEYSEGLEALKARAAVATADIKASFEELDRAHDKTGSALDKLNERYRELSAGKALTGIEKEFEAAGRRRGRGVGNVDEGRGRGSSGHGAAKTAGAGAAAASAPAAVLQGDETASAARAQSELAHLENNRTFYEAEETQAEAHAARLLAIDGNTWNMRLAVAGSSAGQISNMMQNLYVATDKKHRALFETMKAFAIAETIIQTYKAAQGAYAAMASIPVVGPALGIAAAAAAVAAGIARVRVISQTKPGGATGTVSAGGTANPAYSGGSFSAYPAPQRLQGGRPTQEITINIYNPLSEQNWQKIAEDNLLPALKDAKERNVDVSVVNM